MAVLKPAASMSFAIARVFLSPTIESSERIDVLNVDSVTESMSWRTSSTSSGRGIYLG
jgi:hypothetical protein